MAGDAEVIEGVDAVVAVVAPAGCDGPENAASSGSCGSPGPILDKVSVALLTTIVIWSSSSWGATS